MNSRLNGLARLALRTGLALVFVTALARPAAADWLFTPYLGIVFGGAANSVDINTLDEAFEQRANFGGALSGSANGVFGFELDFNYTPNFLQLTEGDEDFEFFDVDSSITTLMGNVVIGIPIGGTTGGGVRPYVTGGAGLMRANVAVEDLFENLSTNELGVNVGGGVHIFFGDNFGLRGDVRYFRAIAQDDDEDVLDVFDDDFLDGNWLSDFDYWRGTIGLTFRFGG
jgi:opacity protein-like surface antigen